MGTENQKLFTLSSALVSLQRTAFPCNAAMLMADRSAPAGLGLWGEKRTGRSTTSAVARYPNNDDQGRRKMRTDQEQIYKQKWRSRANLSKSTNGVADASEAQLPLSSCKGDSLRADASGSPSLRRKSYPRDYSPGQSEGAVEGFHDGGGGFKVGEDALPEGWGQAVDDRTGQVYYFCVGRWALGVSIISGHSPSCEKATLRLRFHGQRLEGVHFLVL